MLLLAHAALPGRIEAATVDHGLRTESAAEAGAVAGFCADMGVPHTSLKVEVAPGNLQSQARDARYAALGRWLEERGLAALVSAHHADDQAETLLARLNRASGFDLTATLVWIIPEQQVSLAAARILWHHYLSSRAS